MDTYTNLFSTITSISVLKKVITFDLMVRFIDPIMKTDLCIVQDLSHLYTLELNYIV